MPTGSPTIDASILLTAAIALTAAVLCVRALVASLRGARIAQKFGAERRCRDRKRIYRIAVILWGLLAALLVLLAIAGPLDILDQLTEVGRRLARDHGWYRARRPLQAILILGILAGSVGATRILILAARTHMPRHLPAVLGFIALAGLVLIDALSLHGVDAMMRQSLLAVSVREMLVLIAIVPVVRCAVISARWTQTVSV